MPVIKLLLKIEIKDQAYVVKCEYFELWMGPGRMIENASLTQTGPQKHLEIEVPQRVFLFNDGPGYGEAQVLLLNFPWWLINLLNSNNVFENFSCKREFDKSGIFDTLKYFPSLDGLILFVIVGLRRDDRDLKDIIRFIEILRRLSGQLHVIVCSNMSEQETKNFVPSIMDGKIYFLEESDVQRDPQILKNKIGTLMRGIIDNGLEINDFWILEYLNKTESFDVFGLPFEQFINKEQLIEEVKLYNRDEYSIWFGSLYKKIMDSFKANFRLANLDFLADSIDNFGTFERMSYLEPFYAPRKRYRDHLLHQTRIAVFGDFFLNLCLDEKTKVIDLINGILRDQEEIDKFTAFKHGDPQSTLTTCMVSWWSIGLTHDSTYPLNAVFSPFLFEKEGREKMLKSYDEEFLAPFIESHQKGLEKFNCEFSENLPAFLDSLKINEHTKKLILKIEKPYLMHNITAAYNLWRKYKKQSKINDHLCLELAAQSILLHHPFAAKKNCDSGRISFNKYPFAFLLILLDEVQDWGRPTIITHDQYDPTRMGRTIALDKIDFEGIARDKKDPGKWYLSGKEILFTLDFEKNDKIEEDVVRYIIESKKKNLNRLHIGAEVLPDIIVRLKFKGKKMVEIPITKRRL